MTLEKFMKSGWGWPVNFALLAVWIAVYGWNIWAQITTGVLVAVGLVRLTIGRDGGWVHRQMAMHLSNMDPEEREAELVKLDKDMREKVVAELGNQKPSSEPGWMDRQMAKTIRLLPAGEREKELEKFKPQERMKVEAALAKLEADATEKSPRGNDG